jgi:hypothetical protein
MSPFLGNHDVTRFMSEAAGQIVGDSRELGFNAPPPPPDRDEPYERMALAWTFTLTQRGVPLIYYGDEVGLPGAADPDNRRMMRFGADLNARESRLLAHVQALGVLRSTHAGLRRGARRSLHTDGDGYVYARGVGDDVALVALNRGGTARTVSVRVPAELSVATSQPLLGWLSQSALPDAQVMRHTPMTHAAVLLGPEAQALPQAPQLPALLLRFTSQPLAGSPSQLAKPALQVSWQAPMTQLAAALAPTGQALPQRPQSVASLWRLAQEFPQRVCPD